MKHTLAIVMTGMVLAAPTLYAADNTTASAAKETAPQAPKFKAHVLSRSELDQLLAHPAQYLVIDVRRPDEISSIGGLPVFLNVQVKDLEQELAWIPKDRTIVTVSNHAARAGVAADLLTSKGFKVAGAAGVQTYEQQGGVLTKFPVPAPTPRAAQVAP
jgi:rhodanese-related sulfurtransferase